MTRVTEGQTLFATVAVAFRNGARLRADAEGLV